MSDSSFDLAVLGSNPLALLLAGLLAERHGKRVVLLAEPPSPFRLSRGFDLSIAPVTRPQTWALIKRTVPETLKVVRGVGKTLVAGVDPVMMAQTETGRDALGHIRHMAAAYGLPVERRGEGVIFRGASLLLRVPFAKAAGSWLDRLGVRRVPRGTLATIRRDGAVRIAGGVEAAQGVLCDDAAVFAHLGPDGERLRASQAVAFLTEPAVKLDSPVVFGIDSGLIAVQHRNGAIEGVGTEAPFVPTTRPLRVAARTTIRTLETVDGAALVGAMRNRIVLAGLGPTGAFLAPMLARFVAGAATGAERDWCLAHDPGKTRGAVTEFGAAA